MSDIQTITIVGRRPPSDDVSIVVDGRQLAGWTDVRITRGIERCPSDFQLGMTDFYPGQADAMQVKPGQACVVKIGRDVVITGYVDRVIPRIAPRQHSITVVGRGKCQDLVDCAAEWPTGQITGSSVLDIAKRLAKPFGVDVAGEEGNRTIPQFNLMLGESPYEIIERLCRISQLLAYETPDGNLLLTATRLDTAASGFAEGINVQAASATWSMDQRFSIYRAFRFGCDVFTDIGAGGNLIGEFPDDGVPRYRPRVLIAEVAGGMGLDNAKDRAQWEGCRRFGRSAEVRLTTDSWRDKGGTLYTPNTLATVDIPSLKIHGKLWTISEVTYHKDANGTSCDILMMPPDAFLVQPTLPPMPIEAEILALPPGLGRRP